jgi:hypothetical protein
MKTSLFITILSFPMLLSCEVLSSNDEADKQKRCQEQFLVCFYILKPEGKVTASDCSLQASMCTGSP